MKAYIMTTGAIFVLVTIAHIWRIVEGHDNLGRDPWYVMLTVVTALLGLWAWRLLRRLPHSR